jgi:hypothetical protein
MCLLNLVRRIHQTSPCSHARCHKRWGWFSVSDFRMIAGSNYWSSNS